MQEQWRPIGICAQSQPPIKSGPVATSGSPRVCWMYALVPRQHSSAGVLSQGVWAEPSAPFFERLGTKSVGHHAVESGWERTEAAGAQRSLSPAEGGWGVGVSSLQAHAFLEHPLPNRSLWRHRPRYGGIAGHVSTDTRVGEETSVTDGSVDMAMRPSPTIIPTSPARARGRLPTLSTTLKVLKYTSSCTNPIPVDSRMASEEDVGDGQSWCQGYGTWTPRLMQLHPLRPHCCLPCAQQSGSGGCNNTGKLEPEARPDTLTSLYLPYPQSNRSTRARPVVTAVRARLCTATFCGYARLCTAALQERVLIKTWCRSNFC